MNVLLDTHVLVWWQAGGQRLSRVASAAIEQADSIFVSPLTFWEVATLRRLGRLELDRVLGAWVHHLLSQPRIATASISAEAAAWAGELETEFPGDPIDRLLYATARDLRVPMVTKDEHLRGYAAKAGEVELMW